MFYLFIETNKSIQPLSEVEICIKEIEEFKDKEIKLKSNPEQPKELEIVMEKPSPTEKLFSDVLFLIEAENAILMRRKDTFTHPSYRQSLPVLRSQTIYLLYLPEDFFVELNQILNFYTHELLGYRFIQTKNLDETTSLILYFKNQTIAESFYIEYNAKKINSNNECLHLIFLEKVFVGENLSQNPLTEFWEMVQLPNCPICIEKLDGSITGLISNVVDYFLCLQSSANRWMKAQSNCKVCQIMNKFLTDPASFTCSLNCAEQEDLWACYICGFIGCGRYKKAHAVDHSEKTLHSMTINLVTSRIWDYIRDNYVHRVLKSRDINVLNLPDSYNDENEDQVSTKYLQERTEALILQYNCLLSQQLDEQKKTI